MTNFGNRTIIDDKELSKTFNEYYINIVQNTTGTTYINTAQAQNLT